MARSGPREKVANPRRVSKLCQFQSRWDRGDRPGDDEPRIVSGLAARYDAAVRADTNPSLPACHRVMTAPQLRIGLGRDIHRLVTGRPLILGGTRVEAEKGCEAHSDGDVLLHAVIDALLGAAGLGDIGEWFPNTDSKWAGADSGRMLAEVLAKLAESQWDIANLDCTISAEHPQLTPYKQQIKSRLASLLSLSPDRINVKAKSGERVGSIGRGEAISAEAVVLLQQVFPSS